jgi:long-chain acyl-CoA synthetase
MSARTINEMLARSADTFPDKPALIFKGREWSFRELNDTIERCAGGLAELGIGKGDTFGIVLRNCPEFVIMSFALARLGAMAVPVNFLEKSERIAYIFNDAKVKGCLTAKDFARTLRTVQESVPTFQHLFLREGDGEIPGIEELYKHPLAETAGPEVASEDVVVLIYTAGTTGLPKGVMLTHRNLVFSCETAVQALEVTHRDSVICVLPMFHAFAWTTNVLLPIFLGATTIVIESLLPFNPTVKAIWKHKVTLICCVPQVYSALVQRIHGPKAILFRLLNPLRMAISGAGPLPAEVQVKFEKVFGTPLLEGYGLTETSPVVSVNPLVGKRKPGTVGIPLPGVEVEIRDEEEKQVAEGEIGEVCVRGENVMAGYYNRPEETRETFTADGWLKTGDLGRFDEDGYLVLVDRKKDLIIVKGLNVYPQEIERVLESHPAVTEAAVIGLTDASGDETVHALVILEQGASVKKRDLTDLCREKLASYKVPREIEFVEELPKNALGKVLKRELRETKAAQS